MIKAHDSITVARKVLRLVNSLSKNKVNGYYECFDNCREQGFCLFSDWDINKKSQGYCIVTQNRNSDNIRIYYGDRSKDLSFNNHPKIDKWEQCVFFSYKEHQKAAKFIINYFLTGEAK